MSSNSTNLNNAYADGADAAHDQIINKCMGYIATDKTIGTPAFNAFWSGYHDEIRDRITEIKAIVGEKTMMCWALA